MKIKTFSSWILVGIWILKLSQGTAVDDLLVIGVDLDPRNPLAYPLQILNYHQIVNIVLDGIPYAVTYDEISGSNVMVNTSSLLGNRTLGSSGYEYQSNAVFYDRGTLSLWDQMQSQAIEGTLFGRNLPIVQTFLTTWGTWKTLYPSTLVLSYDTGFSRDYFVDPYPGYSTDNRIMFPCCYAGKATQEPYSLYSPKQLTLVIVTSQNDVYILPYSELVNLPVLNIVDDITGEPYVVVYDNNQNFVAAFSAFLPTKNISLYFTAIDSNQIIADAFLYNQTFGFLAFGDEETNSTWNLLGYAVSGPLQGEVLPRLPAYTAYWYVAISLFANTTVLYQGQFRRIMILDCPAPISNPTQCPAQCVDFIRVGTFDEVPAIDNPKYISAAAFEAIVRSPNPLAFILTWVATGTVFVVVFIWYIVTKQRQKKKEKNAKEQSEADVPNEESDSISGISEAELSAVSEHTEKSEHKSS
jgi:hypothetical protein